MKNIKFKMLSLGIISAMIISSTPVFATSNTNTSSKIINTTSQSLAKQSKDNSATFTNMNPEQKESIEKSNTNDTLIKNFIKTMDTNHKNEALSAVQSVSSIDPNDPYEPNNGPATATRVSYNSTIYATIGYSGDADAFITHINAGSYIALSLKNIPSGCNYELYLLDKNSNILASSTNTGNTNELIYGTINVSDDYMIVAIGRSGYSSSAQYKLFIGDMPVGTGSVSTSGIANTLKVYSPSGSASTTVDFTNDKSIPSNAQVTSISMPPFSGDGYVSDENYITRTIGNSYGSYTKTGCLSDVYKVSGYMPVKTLWTITFNVAQMSSSYVTWNYPSINISYQYNEIDNL